MQIILLLERNMALIDVKLQKLKKRSIIHYKRGFVGRSVYLFRACLWTAASGCSKDEFFGFGYGQALYVSVKELCIVGYFDNVKATA